MPPRSSWTRWRRASPTSPKAAQEHADALERFLSLGADDFTHAPARLRPGSGSTGSTGRSGDSREARRRAPSWLRSSLRFDVLLLDEPTNDLDFDGLELLERFVTSTPSALVLVSHDRAFLEQTVERVVEFEAETRRIREFAGGWSEYERLREAGRLGDEGAYDATSVSVSGSRRCCEGARARRGSPGRWRTGAGPTRSCPRCATPKRLERLEQVEKPWSPWRLELSLGSRRGGDVVARLEEAVVERDGFRLGPIDLELRHGDRLAIVGPNGSGNRH